MYLMKILFLFLFSNKVLSDSECPYVSTNDDRRVEKNKLRLIQYNVEWLFIDYYASADCPGNGCPWKTISDAENHLEYVAKIVKTLNPDIINFCEVEGCDELNFLISNISDSSYKAYLKKGSDTSTGQNVGQITRIDPLKTLYRTEERYSYPIDGSNCGYKGTGTYGVSKHYITEYKINKYYIAFIGIHLLAYPTDPERCAEREAQAMVIKTIIEKYISINYEIILLGDMNDYDGIILDTNNNKPISKVLEILKTNNILYSVGENITKSDRYSDWYDKNNDCKSSSNEFSMIDHILVSYNLLQHISNVFSYHDYDEYCNTYNSDHYPIIVDFIFD